MSGIKRLIYRSHNGHKDSPVDAAASQRSALGSDENVGEFIASMVGVRAAYVVEENEYMRDKMYHVGTFGFGAKKGISDGYSLHETKVGSVWKPRILIVTNCSICLFALKGKPPTVDSTTDTKAGDPHSSPNSSIRTLGDMGDKAGGSLLNLCEELRTSIPMEDIHYVSEPSIPASQKDFLIKIQSTLVTGYLSTTLIRLKSKEKHNELMNIMELSLRSYRSALDALKEGKFDQNRSLKKTVGVTMVTIATNSHDEKVLHHLVEWDQPVVLQSSADSSISVYLNGFSNQNYVAKILPYMLRCGASRNAPVSIRANPINTNLKSISLQVAIKKSGSSLRESSVIARTPQILLTYTMRETTTIFLVCLVVVFFYAAPEEYLTRDFLLSMMIVPVLTIMLASRSLQQHKPVLGTPTIEKSSAHKYEIIFVSAEENLANGIMDASEDEETYLINNSVSRRNSLVSAVHAMGPSSRSLSVSDHAPQEGIDVLISALSGADKLESLCEDDVPQKWLDATDGNHDDAVRQWKDSLKWRRDFDIDNMLTKPQPKFFIIKQLFPHLWFGLDNKNNLVTLERFGELKKNVKDMIKEGVTADDFAYHCVFLNEYWIKNRLATTGRLNKIVDLKGFGISQLSGEVINFLKPMNALMQQYPELLEQVYIINVPSSFKWVWKIVSPFLAKKTTEKFHIIQNAEKVKETLASVIPSSVIFPEYGGTNELDPKRLAFEFQSANYVRTLNKNNGVDAPMDWHVTQELPIASLVDNGESKLMNELLDTLVGSWVPDNTRSDSMDPLLALQGANVISRKAAALVQIHQSIQVTGMDPLRRFEVTTKAGPVQTIVGGILNAVEPTLCDDGETCHVLYEKVPDGFQVMDGKCIKINSILRNGDRRVVCHAIAQENTNEKFTLITYTSAKKNQTVTIKIIHNRASPHLKTDNGSMDVNLEPRLEPRVALNSI